MHFPVVLYVKHNSSLFLSGKFDQNCCLELFVGFWCSMGSSTCCKSKKLKKLEFVAVFIFNKFFSMTEPDELIQWWCLAGCA